MFGGGTSGSNDCFCDRGDTNDGVPIYADSVAQLMLVYRVDDSGTKYWVVVHEEDAFPISDVVQDSVYYVQDSGAVPPTSGWQVGVQGAYPPPSLAYGDGTACASACAFSDDFSGDLADWGTLTWLNAQTWSIVSGRVRVTRDAPTGYAAGTLQNTLWGACGDDMDASCAVYAVSGYEGIPSIGAAVRCSANNHYELHRYIASGALDVWKVVAASQTQIGTGQSGASDGSVLLLRAVGTSIKGYLGGVLKYNLTDSSVASGNPGITGRTGQGTGSEAEADDFAADPPPACAMVPAAAGPSEMVALWVEVVGDGTISAPYRLGVAGVYDDSIIQDAVTGQVLNRAARIWVPADVAKNLADVSVPAFDSAIINAVTGMRRNAYFVPTGFHPGRAVEWHVGDKAVFDRRTGEYLHTVPGWTWPSREVPGGRVYYRPRPFASVTDAEIESALSAGDMTPIIGSRGAKTEKMWAEEISATGLDKSQRVRVLATLLDYGLEPDTAAAIRDRDGLKGMIVKGR